MSDLPHEWIDDQEDDDEEPDLANLCSDPVGLVTDHFLLQIQQMREEGFSKTDILAGMAFAQCDLAALVAEANEEE